MYKRYGKIYRSFYVIPLHLTHFKQFLRGFVLLSRGYQRKRGERVGKITHFVIEKISALDLNWQRHPGAERSMCPRLDEDRFVRQ